MKYSDLKDLKTAELTKKKKQLTEALFNSKMKNVIGQMTNPLEIRFLRRDIARVSTALTAKKNSK